MEDETGFLGSHSCRRKKGEAPEEPPPLHPYATPWPPRFFVRSHR